MQLILHSKSTKKYAEQIALDYKSYKLIDISTIKNPLPQKHQVIGVGGGKVIDYAKIMAGKRKALVYPTTASGASETSHAVIWHEGSKIDVKTNIPVSVVNTLFLKGLTKYVIKMTSHDALGHTLDSYWSKNATKESKKLSKTAYDMIINQIKNNYNDIPELIFAGMLAGRAIEITGTNMTHAISYALTLKYNIPHGIAVGLAIPYCVKYQKCKLKIPKLDLSVELDAKQIVEDSMKFKKINEGKRKINKEQLVRLLEEAT